MGIQGLLQLIKPCFIEKHIAEYKGQTAAVDTYAWLHRIIKGPSGRSFIAGGNSKYRYVRDCIRRIQKIQNQGVKLILVFDGGPLAGKRQEQKLRKKKRLQKYEKGKELLRNGDDDQGYKKMIQSIDITTEIAYRLIQQLKIHNFEYIVAPYQADAQLAYLNREGIVDFILTQDSDLIAFGAKKILYKFDFHTLSGSQICLNQIRRVKQVSFGWFTHCMFLTTCILSGCDYLNQLQGIGIKTAQKIMAKVGTFKGFLQEMNRVVFPLDYENNFMKAFLTFRFQRVYCPRKKQCVQVNLLQSYISNLDQKKQQLSESLWSQEVLNNEIIDWLNAYPLEDYSFLGQKHSKQIIRQIAQAQIDPVTLREYQPTQENLQFPIQYKTNHNYQSYRRSNYSKKSKESYNSERDGLLKFLQKDKVYDSKKNQNIEYNPLKLTKDYDQFAFFESNHDQDSSQSEKLFQKIRPVPNKKKKNVLQFNDSVDDYEDLIKKKQSKKIIYSDAISCESASLSEVQSNTQFVEIEQIPHLVEIPSLQEIPNFQQIPKTSVQTNMQVVLNQKVTIQVPKRTKFQQLSMSLFKEIFTSEYLSNPFLL